MAMPHNRASMAVASLKYSYATDKVGTINAGYAVDRHSDWGDAGSYRYNRWEWYPSASVRWSPGKLDQSISLSYRRTSSRTPFHYFNPVKHFTSEYAYTCGNPYLKPPSTNWLMLYYRIFGSLTFSSYYTWGNDGVTQFVRDDGNLRCSLGTIWRGGSLRSGLKRYRTSGALWRRFIGAFSQFV